MVGFGVAVGFGVGVLVGFGVAVGFGVGVLVGFGVAVGFGVGVLVGFSVAVGFGGGVLVGFGVAVGAAFTVSVTDALFNGVETVRTAFPALRAYIFFPIISTTEGFVLLQEKSPFSSIILS